MSILRINLADGASMFKAKVWAFLLLIVLVGCHCSKEKISSAKIIKFNLGDEPHTLDPRLARDPSAQMVMRMFFEGLTRIGPNEQPQMAIAQSVEISDDLKRYVFTLRESKWSNGDPVTAGDFVYAWRKILSPDFSSDNASQLYVIKNGKGVKEGSIPMQQLGVKALDERTLQVDLEYPTPYILELLAAPFFSPINQKVEEAQPKWAEKESTYVGNGPFLLGHWRHHDEILAKKNPSYWDADNVKIDGVEMVMLEANTALGMFEKKQLHWVGSPLSVLPLDAIVPLKDKGRVYVKPSAMTAFLRVNVEKDVLNHPKIRHALALAIERGAIAEHVTRGGQIPAMRLVPPSMQLQPEPYFEDGAVTKALHLFEEGLTELGLTREQLPKINLTYISQERTHLIVQAIQQQWFERFGIRIGLEALERKVFFDRISHQDYDLAYCSWSADFHDPVNFLEVFKFKRQSTNNTNWENSEYAQMLSDSFKLVDQDERYQLLARCEKMLMDAMPIIPVLHYTMLYMKDDEVEDVFLSSLGNLDFKWAVMKNDNR
ncbi:MAG: peptide ABC transporter substrate-binding protein [Verrucomicrobia bacterium]|nr:peptide ABC transporter substrate-binding protein [Verrucomicrobiota bacterium]